MQASAVFEGVVEKKTPVLAEWEDSWFPVERWTFRVERSWKGTSETVDVTQGYSNCSEIFSLGERALVYAYPHEFRPGELETHKCGSPREPVQHQVRLLGAPVRTFSLHTPRSEAAFERFARHSHVYALTAGAAARNALTTGGARLWAPGGYAVIGAGVFLFSSFLACVLNRARRRAAAYVLILSIVLLVVVSWWVGRRYITNGFFGHLVEYECAGCPGG